MPWRQEAVLGLAVWLIYLADRLADAFLHPPKEHETARHRFTDRHRVPVAVLVIGLVVTLIFVTPLWLSFNEFLVGLGLLGLAVSYFWMTHCWLDRSWAACFPKEAVVGLLFAIGSMVFVVCECKNFGAATSVGVAAFAFLCFLNCALITRWESTERDRGDVASLLNAFPTLVRFMPIGAVVLALLALIWSLITRSELLMPLAISAALLAFLDCRRSALSLNGLRVLADVVLLSPLCFLLLRP